MTKKELCGSFKHFKIIKIVADEFSILKLIISCSRTYITLEMFCKIMSYINHDHLKRNFHVDKITITTVQFTLSLANRC